MPTATGPPKDVGSLRAYYDARYAGTYMADHSRLELWRVADVLSAIPGGQVATILDFGCGRGAWTSTLRRRFPKARIVGLDVSETAVRRASAKFRDARFETFDGIRAPYGDGAFDLVFSYHVLEHVLSAEETAAEMSRLTRRWLCVCLPCRNVGSFEERMVRRRGGVEVSPTGEPRFPHDEEGHLRRLTSDEVEGLFAANGFVLRCAFFSSQLWGGIEFLLAAGPGVIGKVLGPRRRALRALLAAGHVLFRIHRSGRPTRRGESAAWQALRLLVWASRPVALPVVAPVVGLARREWATRKRDPAGSAQYVIFERAAP